MSWSPHGIGYYWRILPVLSRLFYPKITLLSFHIFSIRQEGTYFRHILTFLVKSPGLCSSTFIFSPFFNIRRICYIAPERFKTRTITVEAATNPTLSTSIISDETPEADGEGDGELLPSMDIFSGEKLERFFVCTVWDLNGVFSKPSGKLIVEVETSNFGKLCKVCVRLNKLDILHFIRFPHLNFGWTRGHGLLIKSEWKYMKSSIFQNTNWNINDFIYLFIPT